MPDLFGPLVTFRTGDALQVLKTLPAGSVHSVVTSPPYFGLRDYQMSGQIGLEVGPAEYVARLVEVFREVHRVLRHDGTFWLNLGDSYAGGGSGSRDPVAWPKQARNDHKTIHAKKHTGLRHKQLIGIPWRVAFALQDDGWILRQDIVWHKTNPMPESVKDRCTRAHEFIFMFSKSPTYFFDSDAIKEPAAKSTKLRASKNYSVGGSNAPGRGDAGYNFRKFQSKDRNKRSVWSIATSPYKGAHFATFPPDLIEPCILSGSPVGGVVLDPFGGAGTTGLVAARNGRDAILIELNPEFTRLAQDRVASHA